MSKRKTKALSDGAIKAFNLLKEHGALTVAEMKELGFQGANSSHLTALKNRGFVQNETVEVEMVSVSKRKVQNYSLIDPDAELEEA